MDVLYETDNFRLEVSAVGNTMGLDLFVLNDFDTATRGGFGFIVNISEDIDGYGQKYDTVGRISFPLKMLERARTDDEKDRILYELYLAMNEIMNSYC